MSEAGALSAASKVCIPTSFLAFVFILAAAALDRLSGRVEVWFPSALQAACQDDLHFRILIPPSGIVAVLELYMDAGRGRAAALLLVPCTSTAPNDEHGLRPSFLRGLETTTFPVERAFLFRRANDLGSQEAAEVRSIHCSSTAI